MTNGITVNEDTKAQLEAVGFGAEYYQRVVDSLERLVANGQGEPSAFSEDLAALGNQADVLKNVAKFSLDKMEELVLTAPAKEITALGGVAKNLKEASFTPERMIHLTKVACPEQITALGGVAEKLKAKKFGSARMIKLAESAEAEGITALGAVVEELEEASFSRRAMVTAAEDISADNLIGLGKVAKILQAAGKKPDEMIELTEKGDFPLIVMVAQIATAHATQAAGAKAEAAVSEKTESARKLGA